MGTAAKLLGEVAHRYHAYLLFVLLAEQSHRSGLLRFLDIHNVRHNRKRRLDFLIYQRLYLLDLLRCHSLKMREVKTETIRCNQRALLLYMAAQHRLQRLLQQMGRAMVLAGVCVLLRCHLQGYLIGYLEHTLGHTSHMANLAAAELDGILYLELAVLGTDHTGITLLTAHGSVERGLLYENGSALAVGQRLCQLAVGGQYGNLGLCGQAVIAYKGRSHLRIDLIVHGSVCAHVVGHRAGLSCLDTLLLHGCLKTILVYGKSLFFQDLLGQVYREAIGIIQLEGILTGKYLLALCFHLCFHLCQNA